MFLRKKGANGRFRFDEIYSCLQKSLRRGDTKLSLEMAKEFNEYPNALKKRLIQNCCEDCPNLYLVNDIFHTETKVESLAKLIPAICAHVKCREATLAFRVACEEPYDFEPLSREDDYLLTVSRKCFTVLCQDNNNG